MARLAAMLGSVFVCATVLLFPSSAAAQLTTDVTFKAAVQVPGAVLQPGVYHFSMARDRKTVSIADATGRIITTVRVVEVSRSSKGPLVTMRPSVDGAPPEVAALYSTGSTRGVEFLYTSANAKP